MKYDAKQVKNTNTRTKIKKEVKRRKLIIDLELGIKKEKFKKTTKIKPRFNFTEKRER